jgi:hypothetical protein
MFRKMTTALALVALLMVAECNSVTGPAADLGSPSTGGNHGPGDRRGSEIGKGVELVPELPGGGGSGPREPIHVAPGAHGPRTPADLSPPSDDPNAGGGGDPGPIVEPVRGGERRIRPGDRSQH